MSFIGTDDYTVTGSVWISGHGFEDAKLSIYARIVEVLSKQDQDNAQPKN